jgi:hypothetical protein
VNMGVKCAIYSLIVFTSVSCNVAKSEMVAKTLDLKISGTGWKCPVGSNYGKKWRTRYPNRALFIKGDFDGNGKLDKAEILDHVNGPRLGLFVKLDSGKTCLLFDTNELKGNPEKIWSYYSRLYGVQIVKPGFYETACGKGYWPCKTSEGELPLIEIKAVGIALFHYDAGGTTYFYWDQKIGKFMSVIIDD